jgi:hypothetical protein
MTNNTHSVTIDVTYTSTISESAAAFDTIEWATRVASDARMGPNVQDVQVRPVESDSSNERPVTFTNEETERIMKFLRTFEASSEAAALTHMIGLRKVYATLDELDAEGTDEDSARGKKFGDMREYPGMNGFPVPIETTPWQRDVLQSIIQLQDQTFDGFVKVTSNDWYAAQELEFKGLIVRKTPNVNDIFQATPRGVAYDREGK